MNRLLLKLIRKLIKQFPWKGWWNKFHNQKHCSTKLFLLTSVIWSTFEFMNGKTLLEFSATIWHLQNFLNILWKFLFPIFILCEKSSFEQLSFEWHGNPNDILFVNPSLRNADKLFSTRAALKKLKIHLQLLFYRRQNLNRN